jgi:lipid A 3-O-deacylase
MIHRALRPVISVVALGLAGAAVPAAAIDRVAFEIGTSAGDTNVDRYGANLAWDWGVEWFKTGHWALTGYWEVGVNAWDADPGRTGTETLVDGHITPVLRWQRDVSTPLPVFFELGVGAHGHSESEIEDKDFDVPFSFGSHIGAGLRFGEGGRYELMYRFQHLSNASIGDKNPGINFHLFNIGYRF